MREATPGMVHAALDALGVRAGDHLLVHSAIQFLGRPAGGAGMYFEVLCRQLGCDQLGQQPAGTLAVPAFNFAFARGEPFDPQATPSQGMGAFAETVRQRPEALRTPHPMQSLAVVGRWASDLAGRDTPSAFDPGSAFERLLELDARLLLLGANVDAISMLHYSEQRFQVPYRYWKDFTGQVRTAQGWETRTYRMFARDLEINPLLSLREVQASLEKRGEWQAVPLNYGLVSLCRAADFVAAVDSFLSADPWSLVTNRAEAFERYQKKYEIDA